MRKPYARQWISTNGELPPRLTSSAILNKRLISALCLGLIQVVGYFDVDDLKIPHATRGGTTRGAPNDLEILPPQDETARDATQGSPVVAERSVEAEFPNTVSLDELASLTVSLVRDDDLQSPTAGRIPLALPVGTVIDILVQTRHVCDSTWAGHLRAYGLAMATSDART